MKFLHDTIQNLLDKAVSSGDEIGCQVAVFANGKLIVDAVAGTIDRERKHHVNSHTLFPVFSAGKGIATTAFLRLVERGLIHPDQKVREIWPEFACNGKEETTVRHILRHRSGVCIRTPYDFIEQIADWDIMCKRVAAAKPVFPPGSATRYQTINYTWLLCELAQRVTGKPFAQIVNEEVFVPAGMNDMFFGVPDSERSRITEAIRGSNLPTAPDPLPCWDYSLETIMNNRVIQQACLPGFNCMTTAIDLAKHYSLLLDSEKNNRLLKRETIREACKMTLAPDDPKPEPSENWTTFGFGYKASRPDADAVGQEFGHGGYGGSIGIASQKNNLAYGFTCNLMNGGAQMRQTLSELFESI